MSCERLGVSTRSAVPKRFGCWTKFAILSPSTGRTALRVEKTKRAGITLITFVYIAIYFLCSGDSKGGGGLGGPCPPPDFCLGSPFGPRRFFLNFPFKFVWLTYVGLPNTFCKNTGHFVNSSRSKLGRNS